MISNRLSVLRISIGLIYIWFGMLKFFKGYSPAESLAIDTIDIITFSTIPHSVSIILLAILEVLIGVFLTFNIFLKQTIMVTLGHLVCTFVPLFAFIPLSFTKAPYAYTLLGQYIFKNIALMAGLWVLYPSKKG
jgi:uncharacterized membrane protein YphA (DoxX/SURF4 family)